MFFRGQRRASDHLIFAAGNNILSYRPRNTRVDCSCHLTVVMNIAEHGKFHLGIVVIWARYVHGLISCYKPLYTIALIYMHMRQGLVA